MGGKKATAGAGDSGDRRHFTFGQNESAANSLAEPIQQLPLGVHDLPCPLCGPQRRSPANRRRRVLRIWREIGFTTWLCARCNDKGHARNGRVDVRELGRVRREAAARDRDAVAKRGELARWLWRRRRPIAGTPAERYLHDARGYSGVIPTTLGYLPPSRGHPPALIAAFGFADEPEPGVISITDAAVQGVHLTKLVPDGSGKAGTDADKIMIGRSTGSPIMIAQPNDLLGLAICEGIEDSLTVYEATGLGVWAAGSAGRIPALTETIPGYVECVTRLLTANRRTRVYRYSRVGPRFCGAVSFWGRAT